jgi:hypothetical protein
MQEALRHVSETIRVTPEVARDWASQWARHVDLYRVGEDGMVEVPRWRHALINFPHPLLKQGLVILDTPGLNAIGAEPELTLSLLPNAHAVLFILGADTGVTQSDLTIWKRAYLRRRFRPARPLVVLNKIDGQWDELKTSEEIDAEIRVRWSRVPISSICRRRRFSRFRPEGPGRQDHRRSGAARTQPLPLLEAALSGELIPAKRDIVCENTESEFGDVSRRVRGLLESRLAGLREQLTELTELRGKNKGVVEYMMGKVRAEKDEFESGLQRYYAVRSVFSTLTNKLFAHLGLDTFAPADARDAGGHARRGLLEDPVDAMAKFFGRSREALSQVGTRSTKSWHDGGGVQALRRRAWSQAGLADGLFAAALRKELDRLQVMVRCHLNTMVSLMTHDKKNITQKFFEEVAVQVRRAFEHANKDAETWLRAIMAPMETQVREHQIQLKRRLESIKRIHQATDTLEDRIAELESVEQEPAGEIQGNWKRLSAGCAKCLPLESSKCGGLIAAVDAKKPAAQSAGLFWVHRSGALVAGQLFVLDPEDVFDLDVVGILGDAVHRADLHALRFVVVTDALRALVGVDDVDLFALGNGLVRAFRFAHVAVDAFVGNNQGHSFPLSVKQWLFARRRLSTQGCTNLLTSPPRRAISRTMVAEMNMYCSPGVRNTVSTSG